MLYRLIAHVETEAAPATSGFGCASFRTHESIVSPKLKVSVPRWEIAHRMLFKCTVFRVESPVLISVHREHGER